MTTPRSVRPLMPALALLATLGGAGGASPPPASLYGQWEYGLVSPIEYYDPSTGKYAEGSGTSEIIRIHPDGTYERNGIIVVSTYSCTSKLLTVSSGTVTVNGSRLTFTPKAAHQKGYTCSPANHHESHNLNASTFTWRLQDQVLLLGDPAGKARDSRYNRPRTTSAGGGAAARSGHTITGTLTAPEGHALADTSVIACPVDGGCGDPKVKMTVLTTSAHTATYALNDLEPMPYEVLAWADTNGNGKPDAGDWVDRASAADVQGEVVNPPATGVKLTLTLWK